jgi:hypothetical protein
MKSYECGLLLLCLSLLCGCANVQPLSAPQLIEIGCPRVTPCQLSASHPVSNGGLDDQLSVTESDWASCAAQIDSIYQCQQNQLSTSGSTTQ